MARRSSRKRRKARRRAEGGTVAAEGGADSAKADGAVAEPSGRGSHDAGGPQAVETTGSSGAVQRGYARGRARNETARAALEPLAEGERPRAVTAGAFVAAALAVAEVVSFAIGYEAGEDSRVVRSVLVIGLLSVMAWGMWRARYWAVLGMQALLGITLVYASVAAMFAANLNAVLLVIAIIVPAGALFWFLVKAMARIQMPRRPGAPMP